MSTAKFDTLQNAAGTKSVPVATVVDGSAKAWVNFNGTGTVAINASFNVSSITDQGVGSYRINFGNNLSDNKYSTVGSSTLNRRFQLASTTLSGSQATTNVDVYITDSGTTAQDVEVVNVAIFR